MEKTIEKSSPNGKVAQEIDPQKLFDTFVEENGLILHVYAISPKSNTPVPIVDYLPENWVKLFILATK